MSYGTVVDLRTAQHLGREAMRHLAPAVSRIEIAGSVRRGKAHVGDIEIVCEPLIQTSLFGDGEEPLVDAVKHRLWSIGKWVRGGARYMKITDLFENPGVSLDVFLVHPPSQWGTLFLIRTGSAGFSTRIATRLKNRGTPFRDGRVVNLATGETIPTPEEEDVFRLAELAFVPPERRW